MFPIYVIFKKEYKDIVRDTRALLTVSLISILAGPLILLMISNMLASFETRAERRVIVVHGIENAPSLENHLKRETTVIEKAPDDYAQALLDGKLVDPVLVIPTDFEEHWLKGEPQSLTIMTNSSNARIHAGVGRVKRWVSGLSGDRNSILLAMRGVSPNAGEFINLEDVDLASAKAETAKIFGLLPYFLVLAALYGVWGSALDTTVGERERGTLEPLLVIPHPAWKVVLGKWCAVVLVGSLIAGIAILSFLPAQWLMQSETLRAMFTFGWFEVLICFVVILPLTGLFAAMLMLVGIFAKNTRQAQANATVVLLISTFLPMMTQLGSNEIKTWHHWFPMLAQHHHILELFKGEPIIYPMLLLSLLAIFITIGVLLVIAVKQFRTHLR